MLQQSEADGMEIARLRQ
jgi:hypothetical protein